MKEEVNKYLDKINKAKTALKNKLRKWIKDESIPLDERWEVFCQSRLGDEHFFIVHFDSLKAIQSLDKKDNFEKMIFRNYVDRYQKCTVEDLYEWLVEYKEEEAEGDTFTVTEKDLLAFKRECLTKFIYQFEIDW